MRMKIEQDFCVLAIKHIGFNPAITAMKRTHGGWQISRVVTERLQSENGIEVVRSIRQIFVVPLAEPGLREALGPMGERPREGQNRR